MPFNAHVKLVVFSSFFQLSDATGIPLQRARSTAVPVTVPQGQRPAPDSDKRDGCGPARKRGFGNSNFVVAICSMLATLSTSGQSLYLSPALVHFVASADSLVLPGAQGIGISVVGTGPLAFKFAGAETGNNRPNFVIVSPPSGVAPGAGALIALNPNIVPWLISGSYALTLQFAAPGQTCPPCAGPDVILDLNFPGDPNITSVVSAASLQPAISPGEIVSIFGTHLSTPPLTAQVDGTGVYPTSLGNPAAGQYMATTTVTFNGIPAPILYGSNNQINAVVPYGVAGQKTANVVVALNLAKSTPFPVTILDTSPGIFTVGQKGNGPGAILNTDMRNGMISINSADNPSPKGWPVVLFGTGAGLWKRAMPDGSTLVAGRADEPAAPVSLTIGGQLARLLYAGPAPSLVSGMLQVNAIVPDGIGSGPQPVVLRSAKTIIRRSRSP